MPKDKKKSTKKKPAPAPLPPVRKSAVVPYRFKNDVLQFLLITPKTKDTKSTKASLWIIPKGTIKADIRPAESARIEALEEAGVLGELHPRIKGFYCFEPKNGAIQEIFTYFMKVSYTMKNWEEKNQRKRMWVALENIRDYIDEPELAEIIEGNENRLRRNLLWERARKMIFPG
ncbi:MAG: NUDIX domain-containing protein [Anaerolineales bacterium]|nr:NUDIX domain-containing protein [Chloroflexota bacterium]MBL6980088.1 NUDIX domain-containing protein [Anaerolineales bacterium]